MVGVHVLVLNAIRKNPNPDFYDRVDHKNGNRKYNHIRNLRFSNRMLNQLNQVHAKGWKTTPYGRFQTQIKLYGKKQHLGNFKTKHEAYNRYREAKRDAFEICDEYQIQ
mgnify:CR=1 FL=1